MTTIQKLYRTLAYVQLRSVAEFLTFTDDEYKAMETGLIEAINQLQRRETTTSTTPPTTISTITFSATKMAYLQNSSSRGSTSSPASCQDQIQP